MANKMLARDSISAKLAECYITINGTRYNAMHALNLQAKLEKTITEVPILGQLARGHKATGLNGTGTASFHMNSSMPREIIKILQDTGVDQYFDIQATVDDPTSAAGRQTIILRDCLMKTTMLINFDADGEYMSEEIEFTFERFEMPEKFNTLAGMIA